MHQFRLEKFENKVFVEVLIQQPWTIIQSTMGQVIDIVAAPFSPPKTDETHGVGAVQKIYMDSSLLSSSAFIVAYMIGLNLEVDHVNTSGDHYTENGENYMIVNPKGSVPALKLVSGNMITEIPIILLSLCDQVPGAGGGLSYPTGTFERIYLLELLCWLEGMHIHVASLYNPAIASSPILRDYFVGKLQEDLVYFDRHVLKTKDKKYIQPHVTVADIYFFTIFKSTYPLNLNLAKVTEECPLVQGYMKRLQLLPKIIGAEQLMAKIAKEKGFPPAAPPSASGLPVSPTPSPKRSASVGSKRPSSRRVSMTQAPDLAF